jgi:uncharacterized membrane protein
MMGQDNTSNSQYGGYSGYTPQPEPDDPYSNQQYGQQQSTFDAYSYGQGGPGQQQQQQYGQQQQQQYAQYQPPASVLEGGTAYDTTSTGLSARLEAVLSYLFWWVSGLIFFVIERKNHFVRFSAAQSLLFFGSASIILEVLSLLGGFLGGIPLIGLVFGLVFGFLTYAVWIVAIITWIFLMIQAFRGKTVRLPFFSTYADNIVRRTSRRQQP